MKICMALTKGRLEDQALEFIKSLNYDIQPLKQKGRQLQVDTGAFQFIFAKGPDVATYVENGVADIGVVGEDILLEYQPDVYDLLPLPFGRCRMTVAGKKISEIQTENKRRIATKYPRIATGFFQGRGESVDIVKLESSVELAPILGLADDIVDIVETGTTLKENGLVVKEEIKNLSARCIANRSALKIKKGLLTPFITMLNERNDIYAASLYS